MKLNVITLFSGYDSQCLALGRLKHHNPQFDYDLVAWSEIDPNAIKAHNALFPQWQDRNLGDVSKVDWQAKAAAFGCKIDLLTYSSPCQDFSSAGLQKGGQQGSGTRSSLLWECERAIETLRPKYLLFENVSALVSEKFRPTFFKWCLTLEKLGYTNHYQLMNAKDYGVPQNRLRIFMVSILGEHAPYYFPKPFPLEKRLKDVLETNVPDRYYLSQERLAGLQIFNEEREKKGQGFRFEPLLDKADTSRCVLTTAGQRPCDTYMQEPCVETVGQYDSSQNSRIIDPNGISQAVINGHKDGTPKVIQPLPAAARGRAAGDWHTSQHRQTLELGDPAAANSVTSVAKDSMIVEPAILQQQRTEEGKEIRRKHKGDKGIPYAYKELAPRQDGITNTLSTVEKDNLLAEPTIIEDFYPDRPARVYEEQAPTIRSDRTGLKVTEPAVEQVAQLYDKASNPQYGRIYNSDGVSPTLVSHGSTQGIDMPKVVEPAVLGWTRNEKGEIIDRHPVEVANCVTAAKRTTFDNYIQEPAVEQVGQLVPDSKFANPQRGRIDSPAGVAPAVDTAQGGNRVAKIIEQAKASHPSRGIIMIKNTPCWVRRLTERELFRLMDVDEPDIDTLLNAGISNTQLAKLAGNSIVTACMYHIFKNLFIETTPPTNTQTQLF